MPLYELQVEMGRIALALGLQIHRVSLKVYEAEAFALVGLNYKSLDPLY